MGSAIDFSTPAGLTARLLARRSAPNNKIDLRLEHERLRLAARDAHTPEVAFVKGTRPVTFECPNGKRLTLVGEAVSASLFIAAQTPNQTETRAAVLSANFTNILRRDLSLFLDGLPVQGTKYYLAGLVYQDERFGSAVAVVLDLMNRLREGHNFVHLPGQRPILTLGTVPLAADIGRIYQADSRRVILGHDGRFLSTGFTGNEPVFTYVAGNSNLFKPVTVPHKDLAGIPEMDPPEIDETTRNHLLAFARVIRHEAGNVRVLLQRAQEMRAYHEPRGEFREALSNACESGTHFLTRLGDFLVRDLASVKELAEIPLFYNLSNPLDKELFSQALLRSTPEARAIIQCHLKIIFGPLLAKFADAVANVQRDLSKNPPELTAENFAAFTGPLSEMKPIADEIKARKLP